MLVERGSEAAFTSLFHHYKDRIYSVSYKLTKSSFLAEEVVQDVFLKLWLRREKLTEISDFQSYIFVMARNIVFTSMKQALSTQILDEEHFQDVAVSYSNADSALLTQEYELIIQQAVDRLSPKQKQIYLLSKDKEMTRDDIAKILEISSETVKTHLARAVRSIREYSMSRLNMSISWLVIFLIK